MAEKIDIHGVMIDNVTMDEALSRVLKMLDGKTPNKIYTPNSEIIMQACRNKSLMDILNSAELTIPDGAGVILASKILGRPLKQKVSGIDLVRKIFESTKNRAISFFILGGKPGVPEKASINIFSEFPKAKIAGFHHGYFKDSEVPDIINKINESKAEILLVGLGAPKQEKWIYNYADKLNSKVIMGIGGSIDVFAGTASLAPEFIRRAGFEWLYRLVRQPSRYKRMMDLPRFMILTLKTRYFKKKVH